MANPRSVTYCVETQLGEYNARLGSLLEGDVVVFVGNLYDGADASLRDVVEVVRHKSNRDKLAVLLSTAGGFIEVVERVVGTLRHSYRHVEFVVPDVAYSAGTVLALSGDKIHMDYYSRLGPIDPQVTLDNGNSVPALGYLARYEALLARANQGSMTAAELAMLMDFDQAELYKFDQARQLSIRLLKEWLVKYKFKDWIVTEERGLEVDDALRESRAEEIASALSDISRWNSHGYGISMTVLRNELRLQINDYGQEPEMADAVRGYHGLLRDYLEMLGYTDALHSAAGLHPLALRHDYDD